MWQNLRNFQDEKQFVRLTKLRDVAIVGRARYRKHEWGCRSISCKQTHAEPLELPAQNFKSNQLTVPVIGEDG